MRTVEPLGDPNPDAVGLPDMALMLSDVLVVFDHLKHTITILVNVYADDGDVEAAYADALATIEKARRLLAGPVPAVEPTPSRARPTFASNMPREQFEAMVARIVEYVHAGDAFQVVPSQRWSAELDADPFSIYRGLRVVNPSPYMYFLDFMDFQIAGASPEPLLTVTGRHVSTRPIAGTRPRGADAAEDAQIADGLLADEKERAEHVMLVDLGRNDLGRVCEYGSVAVDSFMAVETYSHVMHIVSSVSGTLREEVGPMDALRSVLPAGTLSGAPKVRAMQIIDELEPIKRGGYGGAIGYLSYTGDLDTCIHIRTVVIKDGVAHVQAGGGTVADAKPDYEFLRVRGQGEGRPARGRDGDGAARLAMRGARWSTTTTRSPTTSSSTWASWGASSRSCATTARASTSCSSAASTASSSRRGRARPTRPASRSRSRAASRRPACRPSASASATSRWRRPSAARVVRHVPVHGKTTTIEHDGRTIFAGLPSPLTVGRYHSLVVDEASVPDCFEVSASGGGVVMAIRHRELPAEGVQFHPESVLTDDGKLLLKNFLE